MVDGHWVAPFTEENVEERKLHDMLHDIWHLLMAQVIFASVLDMTEGLSGILDNSEAFPLHSSAEKLSFRYCSPSSRRLQR